MKYSLNDLLPQIESIAVAAGEAILEIYNAGFDVETKQDGSPLTLADKRSQDVIVEQLQQITPDIPMIGEESADIEYANRAEWALFWLVDPLDGTKEFVKRNGEFTVNIALVRDGVPILGVVHTPVTSVTHSAAEGIGAFRAEAGRAKQPIRVNTYSGGKATMVASRSHAGEAVTTFRSRLEQNEGEVSIQSMGSSLKICLVAEGKADIYPRLGPTMEWDTAAAQCVLECAGGRVTNTQGEPLRYNKQSLLNPWFLAMGDSRYDWVALARDLES